MHISVKLVGLSVTVVLQCGTFGGYAQTWTYLFMGYETNITLNPGTYNITAYGATGGTGTGGGIGGFGAEMEAQFNFTTMEHLTIVAGGGGGAGYGGGGGGGSFVVQGASSPLVIAGGGGGGTSGGNGSPAGVGTAGSGGGFGVGAGGGGGGGYSGGGGGGYAYPDTGPGIGGGGGSYIDSSAVAILTEVSGIASPDGSPNGEIIITAVPEPSAFVLLCLGLPCVWAARRSVRLTDSRACR